jgi:hypothetical protein
VSNSGSHERLLRGPATPDALLRLPGASRLRPDIKRLFEMYGPDVGSRVVLAVVLDELRDQDPRR